MLLQISVTNETVDGVGENAGEAVTMDTLSIFELLTADGTFYIILPLLILSVIAIYIMVERTLTIKSAAKTDAGFLNQIKDFIYDGKIDAAKSLCENTGGIVPKMIHKGVSRIGKPLNDISTSIENAGKLEVYSLEKNLSILATIAGAAPMIGFLGTVLGMMVTFHEIKSGGQAVEIGQLGGGIMQALVTTVAGLIVGIVAYVGYNVLVSYVENIVNKLETVTIEFMEILQEPAK